MPGGRWGAGDPGLIDTARRETSEEVGVDLSAARLLGTLDDLAPRTATLPPILVRPFVFALPGRVPLVRNSEVADAWWIPLEAFHRPGVLRPYQFPRYGTLIRTIGYHLEVGVVWGMTERLMRTLVALIEM